MPESILHTNLGRLLRRDCKSALLVLALASAFFLFFQLAKQIPSLASVNPSANDPYDAIGSFGVQAALFFGLLGVGRCFWWSRTARELPLRNRLLIVRAWTASVLAVTVALAGDLVASLRYPEVWIGSLVGQEYAVLLGVMVVLVFSIGLYVCFGARDVRGPWTIQAWSRAVSSMAVTMAVLFVYPEDLRASIVGTLFTVLLGAVLLFAPMRFLLLALVPDPVPALAEPTAKGRSTPRWLPWAVLAAAGVVAGLLLFLAEMFSESGGSPPPVARLLLVASVYVGLEVGGLLAGYALLRGPVGLALPPNKRIERMPSALS